MPHDRLRVLVTGATSGIGRGLAEHYAQAGCTVGALARTAERLDDLARMYKGIVPLRGDVTDGSATEELIHRFALEAGGLDLVYANAGIGQQSIQDGWDPDRAREIAMVNVVGMTNTLAPAARIMVEQGSGHLVGISSLAGHVPLPCAAAYGASKAWLAFYLRSLAQDLEPYGITCTVVMPGHVSTEMVDGPSVGVLTPQAQRAAARIAKGVAAGKREIRFPRRMALLVKLAALAPASWRAVGQRRRLAKRRMMRAPSSATKDAR